MDSREYLSLPRAGTKRAGWFANRPLAMKFGILVGVVAVSCGGVVGSMLVGNATVMDSTPIARS